MQSSDKTKIKKRKNRSQKFKSAAIFFFNISEAIHDLFLQRSVGNLLYLQPDRIGNTHKFHTGSLQHALGSQG